ncbi:uncharacterized protein LOC113839186 [Cricetulus griseus]|uniref:uncharacterized protein LOC113839186 n=1 Tax=Cricetulus griseus TaxID=10029 RepID=UPI000F742644|nr:uncharacterized protein LOC113839186 [Cricetulus griseus]
MQSLGFKKRYRYKACPERRQHRVECGLRNAASSGGDSQKRWLIVGVKGRVLQVNSDETLPSHSDSTLGAWPTWDDCQQLLQTLFTSEERERILLEAQKNIPGADRTPSRLDNVINEGFPLDRPNWDFNTAEGMERLTVYRQALVEGLLGAAWCPTNLAKVTLKVEGNPVEFLVDTGAQHSVLLNTSGPLAYKKSWVIGAPGQKQYSWTIRKTVDLGTGRVTHSFLVIPECPAPLLGRDLLIKLGAQIAFKPDGLEVTYSRGVTALTLRMFETPPGQPSDIQQWLQEFPDAWAETAGMRLALNQPRVVIELQTTVTSIQVQQYPLSQEALQGIRPYIQCLLQQGILIPCQSSWNTPLLPDKKPGTRDYRPVQA